jgi:hypothetical protein
LTSPAARPIATPPSTATGTGTSQTSIMPAKEIAASPPIAPTARFIWPMAMITIWESAITMLTAMAASKTCMLKVDRKGGFRAPMTVIATTTTSRSPDQSFCNRRELSRFIAGPQTIL